MCLRSQSAPLRRNVTVQVLGQDRSQTPRGQSDSTFPLGDPGTSASVAAVTAATIAATAPLMKVDISIITLMNSKSITVL